MRQSRHIVRVPNTVDSDISGGAVALASSSKVNTMAGIDNEKAQNDDSERGEGTKAQDEQPEQQGPTPKRKRTRAAKASAGPYKRPVRGKQGRLANLMKMPIDVFTEIALHLTPRDVISLARSSRFFRSLLMRRSALHIWLGAMRNVPGLPACPPDMSEPQYLALIYTRNCSICGGATVNRQMDPVLRIRPCTSCRKKALISILDIGGVTGSFVVYSNSIMPNKHNDRPHALKSDVEFVDAKLDELKNSNDPHALQTWANERKQSLVRRYNQATELRGFLEGLERGREDELKDMRAQRRKDVEERLVSEGWVQEDLVFGYPDKRDWVSLVEKAQVLTERTWANLKPKLVPLLETNREKRLKREANARMQARRESLVAYLSEMRISAEPIVEEKIHDPTPTASTSSPTTSEIRYMGIFPSISDGLEWPELKELLEEDAPIEGMMERIVLVSDKLCDLAKEWITRVELKLAELLRRGRTEDGLAMEIPTCTLPLARESGLYPIDNVTDDQKLLLRADSLFCHIRNDSGVTYDRLVKTGYSEVRFDYIQLRQLPGLPFDVNRCERHAVAQAQARKILEWMGKPDATFLEMESTGSVYVCGRCPEETGCTWEDLVNHFVAQANDWTIIQASPDLLAKNGVTFRDVHDAAWDTDKPLVRVMSKSDITHMIIGGEVDCKLCTRSRLPIATRGRKGKIVEHIQDVHDILEPVTPDHYGPAHLPSLFSGLFGSSEDSNSDGPHLWDDEYDWSDDSF